MAAAAVLTVVQKVLIPHPIIVRVILFFHQPVARIDNEINARESKMKRNLSFLIGVMAICIVLFSVSARAQCVGDSSNCYSTTGYETCVYGTSVYACVDITSLCGNDPSAGYCDPGCYDGNFCISGCYGSHYRGCSRCPSSHPNSDGGQNAYANQCYKICETGGRDSIGNYTYNVSGNGREYY